MSSGDTLFALMQARKQVGNRATTKTPAPASRRGSQYPIWQATQRRWQSIYRQKQACSGWLRRQVLLQLHRLSLSTRTSVCQADCPMRGTVSPCSWYLIAVHLFAAQCAALTARWPPGLQCCCCHDCFNTPVSVSACAALQVTCASCFMHLVTGPM